jgi:hypothetical protein
MRFTGAVSKGKKFEIIYSMFYNTSMEEGKTIRQNISCRFVGSEMMVGNKFRTSLSALEVT